MAGNQENKMKAFGLVLYSNMKCYMDIMWNIGNLVITKTGKEGNFIRMEREKKLQPKASMGRWGGGQKKSSL